jgi:hypothetical protein
MTIVPIPLGHCLGDPPDCCLGMKRLSLMLSIADDERGKPLVVHREDQPCFAIHITHLYSGVPGDPDPHPRSIKLIAHLEVWLPFGVKGERGSRVPLLINEAELLGADGGRHLSCRFLRRDKASPDKTGRNN